MAEGALSSPVFIRILKPILPSRVMRHLAQARSRGLRATMGAAWRRLSRRTLFARAERHRRRLTGVTFVAITGSTGKSSARAMIAAVLRTAGTCAEARTNIPTGVAHGVLDTSPTHRFSLAETAAARPGYLDPSLRVFQPHIGVVTNVGADHRAAFRNAEGIAREKGKLVEVLPPDGVAVLNADDPHVIAMRSRTAARVITYGLSPGAMVRGEGITGAWPDRFAMTVVHGDEAVRVQTRFCGTHWGHAVLAAVAAGLAAGIAMRDAAAAIEGVEPPEGRMSPVTLANGITFIRDDWKASLPTLAPAFAFLRDARAARKIAVLGSISDYPGSRERHYERAALAAREVADILIMVSAHATTGLCARRHPGDDTVMAFPTARKAAAYLEGLLRPGDLVLVKGSNKADHLSRLVLARTQTVTCWRARCGRNRYCGACELIDRPWPPGAQTNGDAGGATRRRRAAARENTAHHTPETMAGDAPADGAPVVVGLGNPGAQYGGTPHNIGYAVVDLLAARLGAAWQSEGEASVGVARWNGGVVRLLKAGVPMNRTGPALARLGRRLGFSPAECILVYDDVDLPFGAVRTKLRGSSGGHRGVTSILHEFQSQEFRRVKVGVGRPGARATRGTLLIPFADADRPTMDRSFEAAADKVLDLLRTQT